MAVHRPSLDGPPLELLTFRADDWLPDASPYWAWLMARFEWARSHPNDFRLGGDALDMLRQRAAWRRGSSGGNTATPTPNHL
jgi:hypothetical protein